MKKRMHIVVAAAFAMALVAAFALVGCSSGSNSASASATSASASSASASAATSSAAASGEAVELQIFAANSLSKAMAEVQDLYTKQNPNVTFADTQYKSSGELNSMLEGGAYADIEITASKGTMDKAEEAGYIDPATRITMFKNDLVMVTESAQDNTSSDDTAQGLARGQITRGELQRAAYNICRFLLDTPAYLRMYGRETDLDRSLSVIRES